MREISGRPTVQPCLRIGHSQAVTARGTLFCGRQKVEEVHPMRNVEKECGKLLRNREFAVKSALAQSLAVVTDGADPAAFFDSFADKECPRHSVCGAVWKPRSIAYRCLVCEVNPNSAVCVDCFRAGDHAGHDYRIVHTLSLIHI